MCNKSSHPDSHDGGAGAARRDFLKVIALSAAGLGITASRPASAKAPDASPGPTRLFELAKPLKVKPVLVYHMYERREEATWREWGGLKSEQDVDREATKIAAELSEMSGKADFKLDVMPPDKVNSDESLKKALAADCDLYLVYGAGAGGPGLYSFTWIEALADSGKPNVMFLRHKSGPISLLYETVHPYFLRKGKDGFVQKNLTIDDVVVDDYGQVLWRLRAWRGLLATKGAKIVAVGGPGSGGLPHECPASAKGTWNLDIITVADEKLKERISRAHADQAAVDLARRQMREYLQDGVVAVEAKEESILSAFILANALMDVMRENGAGAVTVKNCMGFGPIAKTTPCLALSMINDTGRMAFCESDFSVIPAGMLLSNISGKPVFLSDPTFPHDGVTTCAHCSSTRRLDGVNLEPVKILTHCESDYGAAPKVLFRKGQRITNLAPSFAGDKWVGFTGTITDHPSYDICRSQFDCTIEGDWKKLLREMPGFHWITGYGQYLDEIGYALGKVGVQWVNVSG
ncbi:MAG: sugar isomerase [Planctomycetia bacterium]|nr:sugar isomerase [Planctomycetia bacterium]